ncbi:MAG: hypothetical protein AB1453_01870, partial [Chloroflexota bacterium]
MTAAQSASRREKNGGKLSEEIRMVRHLISRVRAMANEGTPLKEMLSVLETVARASTHLANLLKTEKLLEGEQSAGELVRAALAEMRAEMDANGI